jgi:chlorobactene glucosyltransferase
MNDSFTVFLGGMVVFLMALLAVALVNARAMRPVGAAPTPERWPAVSVLVPARNEASRLEVCLRSLLEQDYPAFEVLALDDESTDETAEILQSVAGRERRLRALTGDPIPGGWTGKAWACHQLSQAAGGEILFFTDADTIHGPQSIRRAVAALLAERADLLSVLPRQRTETWGERLLVPILPWSVLAFFPLPLAYRLRLPFLPVAVGQALLFPADSYHRMGGHAAVRASVVEDIALARRADALGARWRLADGTQEIDCRMYAGLRDALDGLGKNLFAVFGFRPLPFLFVWSWLPLIFIGPPMLALFEAGVGFPHPGRFLLSVLAILAGLGIWSVAVFKLRLPRLALVLYPGIILAASAAAVRSFFLHLGRRSQWKGRRLPQPAL